MKRFQSYLFRFSFQGCAGIKARTLCTSSTHSITDLHSNLKSTFLVILGVFLLTAFYPLYFCLVSTNQITNLLREGQVYQFKSDSQEHHVFYSCINMSKKDHVPQWSFPIQRPQLNLHGVHCLCSLQEAALPTSLSLTVYPLQQKLSSLAQGSVSVFVSHGTGSRSKEMSENGMSCPQLLRSSSNCSQELCRLSPYISNYKTSLDSGSCSLPQVPNPLTSFRVTLLHRYPVLL